MTEKVYIVDGSGYIFRAYYAVQPLSTSQGFPTNALFGFSRMLLKLLNAADSRHVVMVFDAGKETFRNKLYDQYKANRTECPEDLVAQMPFFREISKAIGLPLLEQPGFEADDIIGTLTTRLRDAGYEIVIVSGDKDLMQLVGETVTVWDTMRDKRYGIEQVKEKFGVLPEKVVEVLGLIGDDSDNIPGLKGAGPKTALQLIEKYGDVETVLNSVEQIREDSSIRNRKKIADQIESDKELIRLSRKLVQIELNCPVEMTLRGETANITALNDQQILDASLRHAPDAKLLNHLSEKLEFGSIFKEFQLQVPEDNSAQQAKVKYQAIGTSDFADWLKILSSQKEFAFDLETTSLDVLEAEIVGASFCWSDEHAYYLPIGHKHGEYQIKIDDFISRVGPILANSSVGKIGQNLKYDIGVMARYGVVVEGVSFDTMIASYLINPDKSSHNLTVLAREYLGLGIIEYEDVVGQLANFSEVEIAKATTYACQDAHYALMLKIKLGALIKDRDLERVLHEIELPLVSVLSRMERKGVKIDSELMANLSAECTVQLAELQKELFALSGCEFNINSPKQLAEVLFNKLGLPTKGLKKTKSGISTDQSVLEKLSDIHPLPKLLLRYRMLHKLKSTYIDVLPQMVSPVSRRLHTRLNQTGTGTGRLSSSDPNLQNIPIQTPEGRRIREAFIAESGNVLISADYSQIELRLLAHMSQDANMIEAFSQGQDIHARTAREILNIGPFEDVSSEQRRIGKTINFGIIYGMGPYRLARDLGISVGIATSYIDGYFNRFPGVKKFFSKVEEDAVRLDYVTTLFGRKRFLNTIDTSGRDQGFIARVAVNAPLQGTAADIIKLAMISLDARIRREKMPVDLILQIHDELLLECQSQMAAQLSEVVRQEMESVIKLLVPLKVDVGIGKNWQEAQS
jgi:DNA polymerase-1